MTGCLADPDFSELAKDILSGFDRRVTALPQDVCAPFHAEAKQLEGELLLLYRLAALCVRNEEDVSRVASRWEEMANFCDDSLARLKALSQNHPGCGADIYFDRILEIRIRCKRLQEMHT